ncbi:MAG: class I SAM-dependent methyltransferase [Phycisphaerae bacterium]|nr:class I SAM-dependent methyltransferase [Phycisphaerae bacterium]
MSRHQPDQPDADATGQSQPLPTDDAPQPSSSENIAPNGPTQAIPVAPEPFRLSDTASLVMAWALPLYRDGAARRFIERLDLSAGEALRRQCEALCPWYREVILNRKAFISHLIERALATRPEPRQIIIPAAGASPLALELLSAHGDRISRVIEMDVSGMDRKRQLYAEVAPELTHKLNCLEVDVTDPAFRRALVLDGRYDPDVDAIVLLEGISYYLTPRDLVLFLMTFCSPTRRNRVVLEHLLPSADVNDPRRGIPNAVFKAIQAYGHLPRIQRYGLADAPALLREAGGTPDAHFTMDEMERHRIGKHHYFQQPRDGWIACMTGWI